MKKIKYIIFSVLLTLVFIPNVYADSIKTYVNGPGSIYPDNNIKVSVGVSSAPLLYGFTGKISYDTSKLKLGKSSGLSGFSILLGENLTADSATGKSGSFSFLELSFVPTSGFKSGEKTTISFSNVETSDGDNTLTGTNSSLTITMKAPKSKNNYLSSLKVSEGNIDFNKNKDTYSIVLEHDIASLSIDAKAEDSKSKVTGTGAKTLKDYENIFKIVVKSESGAEKTYTIIATRKDKDGKTTKPKVEVEEKKPTLDDLKIEGYDIKFDKNVYNYSIDLKEKDTKLNIIPTYDEAKYEYNINIPKEFIVGENQVKLTLKDKNNNIIEYSIIVFKKEIIKEVPNEKQTCKCPPRPSNSTIYKKIFFIENFIILILLITMFIIKNKKYKNQNYKNN